MLMTAAKKTAPVKKISISLPLGLASAALKKISKKRRPFEKLNFSEYVRELIRTDLGMEP